MLLKVGTQDSNALKITLTKFHQHLSTGSQVFKDWDKQQQQRRLTTQSVLCYSPRRQLIVEDKNCATNGPTPLTGATNPNIENQRKHVIRDRILAIKFTGLLIVKMTDTSVDFHPVPLEVFRHVHATLPSFVRRFFSPFGKFWFLAFLRSFASLIPPK